ncbi:MAG: 4-hydroxy-3-methylbut-2-enyl diphosphate reductase [Candidatus Hydrogenedentes bacterium]|nr:4-hydroxy-3-methylbut-2-enyl diphosphate reductase [Candidatus Hydrogenedentota bacterium]
MAIERVVLANPRGFCAGVVRAVDIVEQVLDLVDSPIYVFHEIVHNVHVVDRLRARGAVFVESIADIPEGAVCVFSAHGISPEVRNEANEKGLRVIDATCPLVTKVHLEVIRYAKAGYSIVLIGHAGHEEVEGTMGEAPMHLVSTVSDVESLAVENAEKLIYLTQTTLSLDDTARIVEALRAKFPSIQSPPKDDICYATQNRQNSVKELAAKVDVVLVTGSQNSSNSQRLCEVAASVGVSAYLINDETEIRSEWFEGKRVVGVTAGASAPEDCVRRILDHLKTLGAAVVEELRTATEKVHFSMPREFFALVESLRHTAPGTTQQSMVPSPSAMNQ